ncbi:MAG: PilN domain-containing protein [Methylomonas sp.]|nr:PilN domain-containing protein [Methylomonas sp.]
MNLDTTINIDLKGFFQWWGRELAFLLPKTLRLKLREHRGRIIFSAASQPFEIACYDDDDNLLEIRQFDSLDSGIYRKFTEQYPLLENAEIILRLADHQALQKVLYLPLAAQENLLQVIGFELDRYTPFNADQVYFNTLPLGHTGHGQIQVLLIVVPKRRLDEQLALLESLGVRPHRVDYQAAVEGFPQTLDAYNLLPDRYRMRGDRWEQWTHWSLGFLTLLSMLAVMVWPVWMEGQAVQRIKARISQLENQNRVVNAQQAEIDALRAETQKLIAIKHQSPALLAILNELSHLLNDETWLTHLQFSAQHMQIQGQSPTASALIGMLEASDYFVNVSFVSPLTQDKITGRERFQIGMDISVPPLSGEVQAPAQGEASSDALEEPVLDNGEQAASGDGSGE